MSKNRTGDKQCFDFKVFAEIYNRNHQAYVVYITLLREAQRKFQIFTYISYERIVSGCAPNLKSEQFFSEYWNGRNCSDTGQFLSNCSGALAPE